MYFNSEEEQVPVKISKLAVTSLVLGLLSPVTIYFSMFSGVGFGLSIGLVIVANLSAIAASILGIIAVKRIENSDNLKGRNLALTGSVLGFLLLFLEVLFIILFIVTTRNM